MCEWGNEIILMVPIPPSLSHTGKFRWGLKGVDACIAPIVQALNDAGIYTANCCCGHGATDGEIILHNGTILRVKGKTMLSKFERVEVHWQDTASFEGWKNREQLDEIIALECVLMKSIGWLVSDTDTHIVIAQTVGKKHCDGILQIPKISIVDIYKNVGGNS